MNHLREGKGVCTLASFDRSSTDPPPAFFSVNYEQWRDQYSGANRIFQAACRAEIALWETALNPGS